MRGAMVVLLLSLSPVEAGQRDACTLDSDPEPSPRLLALLRHAGDTLGHVDPALGERQYAIVRDYQVTWAFAAGPKLWATATPCVGLRALFRSRLLGADNLAVEIYEFRYRTETAARRAAAIWRQDADPNPFGKHPRDAWASGTSAFVGVGRWADPDALARLMAQLKATP